VKISNETKVGAIAIVSIVLLILGFNFLKGKKVLSKSTTIYAVYSNVQGLAASNAVVINGLEVGTVYDLSPSRDMREIIVTLNITKQIDIPSNSIAFIKSNPITNTSIEITLGDANTYLKANDTIHTMPNEGMLQEVMKKVDPVLNQVKKTFSSLDTLVNNINSSFDAHAKTNIAATLDHLNSITRTLVAASESLKAILDTRSGPLAGTLKNINDVTGNLASNNGHISNIMANLDSTSAKFAKLDLEHTISAMDIAIRELQTTLSKINSDSGSIGLLMNDPKLYNNLTATSNKINILLDDIRLHPKRYINVSLMGGSKKSETPLMEPLPDTINAPYLKKKVE